MDLYRIKLAKESFKFSATHFTLFGPTEAERLHGHNYHVAVECELTSLGSLAMGFEFNSLKPLIKKIADQWDERVLIPKRSPFLRIQEELVRDRAHWAIDFHNRSYRLPSEDVVMLESENVTSEELARQFAVQLSIAWKKATADDHALHERISQLCVSIEETRGQCASFSISRPLATSFAGSDPR